MPVRTLYLYPRLFWENETTDRPIGCFCRCCLTDEGSDRALIHIAAFPLCGGQPRAARSRGLSPARASAALSQPGGADSMSPQPPDSFCS
ncbi:MAG: hypothetical protein ACLRWP_19620 [Bilophila wadsworthia]